MNTLYGPPISSTPAPERQTEESERGWNRTLCDKLSSVLAPGAVHNFDIWHPPVGTAVYEHFLTERVLKPVETPRFQGYVQVDYWNDDGGRNPGEEIGTQAAVIITGLYEGKIVFFSNAAKETQELFPMPVVNDALQECLEALQATADRATNE